MREAKGGGIIVGEMRDVKRGMVGEVGDVGPIREDRMWIRVGRSMGLGWRC